MRRYRPFRKLIELERWPDSLCGDCLSMVDLLLALAFVAMILSPPILATRHRSRTHRRSKPGW